MEHHDHEWISIADMLSGFAAVLIMVILTIEAPDARTPEQNATKEALEGTFKKIAAGSNGRISFLSGDQQCSLILKEGVFEQGSPRMTDEMSSLIKNRIMTLQGIVREKNIVLRVEGHADNSMIGGGKRIKVESDALNYKSGAFASSYPYDNVLLSLQRAMEARRLITESWGIDLTEKVSVLGYGFNKPLNSNNPGADENRRVEITIEYF